MTQELKDKLIALAEKYENSDFIKSDPSKFMHQIADCKNQEVVAFLSANLAFGRREQILSHIQKILDNSGNDIANWILNEKHLSFFPNNENSFYRTYTNNAMISFFQSIKEILKKSDSLGSFFEIEHKKNIKNNSDFMLHKTIMQFFPKECTLLPHSEDSAAKKLNMFLRWMVRDNSPVDLGIWTWHNKKNLLIPLDTHVMQEATRFGLLQPNKNGKVKSANLKTAIELTEKLSEAFPDDPCKGDFALFGLGVNSTSSTLS